jgi:hypothetical protein
MHTNNLTPHYTDSYATPTRNNAQHSLSHSDHDGQHFLPATGSRDVDRHGHGYGAELLVLLASSHPEPCAWLLRQLGIFLAQKEGKSLHLMSQKRGAVQCDSSICDSKLTGLVCSHVQVRKGKYPGGPKSMITSKNVLNGGLSDAEVARLYRNDKRAVKSRSRSRSRGRTEQETVQGRHSRSQADGNVSRQGSRLGRMRSQRSRVSPGRDREGEFERKRRWAQRVAQDGYGPVRVPGSSVAGSSTGPW